MGREWTADDVRKLIGGTGGTNEWTAEQVKSLLDTSPVRTKNSVSMPQAEVPTLDTPYKNSKTGTGISDLKQLSGGSAVIKNTAQEIPVLKPSNTEKIGNSKSKDIVQRIPVFKSLNEGKSVDDMLAMSDEEFNKYLIETGHKSAEYNAFDRLFDQKARDAYAEFQTATDAQDYRSDQKVINLIKEKGGSDEVIAYINGEIDALSPALRKYGYNAQELENIKNLVDRDKNLKDSERWAAEHPVLGSLLSFGTNLMGSAGIIEQGINFLEGKPVDTEQTGAMGDLTQNLRGGASSEMGNVGKFLYDAGMSVGDVATNAVTGGGAASMAMNAASTSALNAIERGVDPTRALGTGFASAAAEYITEAISLGNLKALKSAGESGIKGFLTSVGKQMLVEGTEEAASEIINQISDYAINQDLSRAVLEYNALIADGMSENDAKAQIAKGIATEIVMSALGGAVSGGMMGGGANLLGHAINAKNRKGAKSAQIAEDLVDPKNTAAVPENALEKAAKAAESTLNDVVNNTVENKETHTPEQLRVMEEYKNSIDDEVVQFVNDAREGKTVRPITITMVSNKAASDIEEKVGMKVYGNRVVLDANGANHIQKRHGKNGNSDHSMADDADIARMQYVLDNYDSVNFYGEYAEGYVDKNGKRAPKIVFEKRIDGSYYVVEAVSDSKTKRNYIVSAFIADADNFHKIKAAKQSLDVQAPQVTSKNAAVQTALGHPTRPDVHSPRALRPERSVGKADSELHHVPSALENSSPLANVQDVHENNSSTESIPNPSEKVNVEDGKTYDDISVIGFEDMSKQLDRTVATFKGKQNTLQYLADVKRAINEYVDTNSDESFEKIMDAADNLNKSLQGTQYTSKRYNKHGGNVTKYDDRVLSIINEEIKNITEVAKENAISRAMEEYDNIRANNNGEMKQRGYNQSIVNKTDLPDDVKNEFITNPQMYEVLKNKTTQEQAQYIIDNTTTEQAIAQFNGMVDQKDPVSVPLGYYLSQKLIGEGRTDTAVEVLRNMSTKLTEAGQFTQAAAITLMKGDPVTALKYVTRELDALNAKGREQYKDKWTDFKLTDAETEMFGKLQVGDTEGIKAAYESIFDRIQRQYPATMKEKLLEFRRIAMLLNVRTNVKNVVSNFLLMPVRWSSDRVSAIGQNAIKLINPDFQTTQAVRVDKQSKALAKDAWETVKESILETGNKYEDTQQAVRNKQVFKGTAFSRFIDNVTNGAITKLNSRLGKKADPSIMETARNMTYWLLGKGDDIFVQKNFESRMASYLAAQKITDLESIPADAYTLATQEALKATFKDDTALSKTLSNAKKNFGVVGEAVLPFTKTPANLAMRGIDYSPAGLIRDVVNLAKKKNRTHADVTQAMDNLSKGAIGTAAIFAGYMLAKSGLISGALSDDKDEAAFQKQTGMLPYAIHIGQNYYTYDWAQPAAIPIILGATIYQSSKESDNALNAWTQGALAATNAWFDLSPLQSLEEIFGGYGTPAENLMGVIADLPGSLVPAQLGAAARIADTTQRQTYSKGDFWGTRVNEIAAKIPGLSQTLPAAYDTWGNEIKRSDTTGEAAFAQLINPGQLGNANVTPIDGEISRLFTSTGEKMVFPRKAAWSYSFDGESHKLDNVTYSEMQKRMGKTSYELASGFIESSEYKDLDDNQRASILANLYGFSEALAKSDMLGYNIAGNSTYKTYYKIYNDLGLEYVARYMIYRIGADTNGNDNISGAEAEEYLQSKTIPKLEKRYWYSAMCPTNKNNPFE